MLRQSGAVVEGVGELAGAVLVPEGGQDGQAAASVLTDDGRIAADAQQACFLPRHLAGHLEATRSPARKPAIAETRATSPRVFMKARRVPAQAAEA